MEMKVLLIFLVIIAFVDIKSFRIPNVLILAGTLTGTIMTLMSYEAKDVFKRVISALIIFSVFYPFFLMRGIGAGDIKLFAMSALYFDGNRIFIYIALTMVIAGIISIAKMIIFEESRMRLKYLITYLRKTAMTVSAGVIDKYEISYSSDLKVRARSVIRLSVPALLSVIMIMAIF
ncbi:MAG: prepilin peptidase [Lachnospiraceae bacterium]|nr:prepilin peptidase [Lachnospiraceae bacterium]MEE0920008.1 A24 family peptidase [Lachnospiraceae bacterium]